MVAAVGLSLGGLEVNIAIILVHYAVLFLCVLPFLGLDVRRLLVLAAGWVLVTPALAFLLRPWLLTADARLQLGHNPEWEDLSTPAVLLGDLFLTGYYPVLQWITYLLIGLAIGRLALTTASVPVLLLAAGTLVAVAAKWLSVVLMEDWGGRAALQASLLESLRIRWRASCRSTWPAWTRPAPPGGSPPAPRIRAPRWICCTPRGSRPPSSASACCWAGWSCGPGLDLLLPLRGAGAMTLSLYTAHLCVMASLYGQPLPAGWTVEGVYWAQAVAALVIGGIFAALSWRGPLEWVAHAANQLGRFQPARLR